MQLLSNTLADEAKIIVSVWPDFVIGDPEPASLVEHDLVGIYMKDPTEKDES